VSYQNGRPGFVGVIIQLSIKGAQANLSAKNKEKI
jgi:hypothetical protein